MKRTVKLNLLQLNLGMPLTENICLAESVYILAFRVWSLNSRVLLKLAGGFLGMYTVETMKSNYLNMSRKTQDDPALLFFSLLP